MNKKLTAKIQQIKPAQKDYSTIFSDILIIKPDDSELILKKGSLYVLVDIEQTVQFDTKLATKIVHDILMDSYYQSENISIIQSVEKAVSEAKDSITKLAIESGRGTENSVQINILCGALWGNVFYIVKYGEGAIYAVRNGMLRNIDTITEGSFSSASGVVKDDDVIALCTKEFADKHPPEDLLKSTGTLDSLPDNAACLVLKFNVETTFSENEVVKIVNPMVKRKKLNFSGLKFSMSRMTKPKINIKTLSAFIALFFVVSIIITAGKNRSQKPETTQPANSVSEVMGSESPKQPEAPTTDTSKDAETKTERVSSAPIYDLKIANQNVNPSDISISSTDILVTDNTLGKFFASDINTIKFTESQNTFSGINSPQFIDGKIFFSYKDGYVEYDVANAKALNTYTASGLTTTYPYLTFVYSAENGKLIKYTKKDTTLSGSEWAQSADFNNVKSMSIAISIYVVKSDGTLAKYTQGSKDAFEVKGIDTPITSAVKIVTDVDFKNLYIADSANKRLVVCDKDGTFIKQYKYATDTEWNDIKSFGVTPKENKVVLLNGSKLYEFSL